MSDTKYPRKSELQTDIEKMLLDMIGDFIADEVPAPEPGEDASWLSIPAVKIMDRVRLDMEEQHRKEMAQAAAAVRAVERVKHVLNTPKRKPTVFVESYEDDV